MSLTLFTRKAFVLSALFFVTILFSCKKDGKLSPDFDNGNLSTIFTDTFSLKTSVIEDPAGRTDVAVNHLLGVYNDPIFGMKSSSIYTNVGLVGATDFGTGFVVDSLVLSLKVAEYYGNDTSSFTVNVFELTTPLLNSTSYFSNTYSPIQNTLLGSVLFTPSSANSALRIVITEPGLIGKIQSKRSYLDNSAFNSVLKGLYIVTADTAGGTSTISQGDGAIAILDLNSSLSKLTIHYKNYIKNLSGNSSQVLIPQLKQEDFIINNDVKTYSRFINDYSGTDVEKHLPNSPNAASKNANRTYVSTMKGVRTKLEIPNIKELANKGRISINKAEITITMETGTEGSYDEVLSSLYLTGIDENDNAIILLDDPTLEGSDHYGGTFNPTTKSFTYNVTKHIHQLINSTATDYGMYLTANGAVTTANRIVLNSENSSVSKIKLKITYSKL